MTDEVGIYAECSECNRCWGNGNGNKLIPEDHNSFKIEYDKDGYKFEDNGHYSFKTVQFIYQTLTSKTEEHTFTLV